jgi:two-component system phosphate regulon response regulator PhoB
VKKVLVVDDKVGVRELLTATLDVGDFELLEADNGVSAVNAARTHHPDLIILDVMMPGTLDGFGVCSTLKKDPKTSDITILMLTALGQDGDKAKGYEAGADDYFVKPFSPRELLDKVYGILEI